MFNYWEGKYMFPKISVLNHGLSVMTLILATKTLKTISYGLLSNFQSCMQRKKTKYDITLNSNCSGCRGGSEAKNSVCSSRAPALIPSIQKVAPKHLSL